MCQKPRVKLSFCKPAGVGSYTDHPAGIGELVGLQFALVAVSDML